MRKHPTRRRRWLWLWLRRWRRRSQGFVDAPPRHLRCMCCVSVASKWFGQQFGCDEFDLELDFARWKEIRMKCIAIWEFRMCEMRMCCSSPSLHLGDLNFHTNLGFLGVCFDTEAFRILGPGSDAGGLLCFPAWVRSISGLKLLDKCVDGFEEFCF